MEYINLNISDIKTENQDSLSELIRSNNNIDLSISTENSAKKPVQMGGGLLDFFGFGISDNDKKILQAARDRDYDFVNTSINKDMMDDIESQDDDGYTILHYLVRDKMLNPGANESIKKILDGSDVSSFINKTDKNGNTPLHLAVAGGFMDIADLLIEKGADKSIKNDDGNYVEEVETDSTQSKSDNRLTPASETKIIIPDKELLDKLDITLNTFIKGKNQTEEQSEKISDNLPQTVKSQESPSSGGSPYSANSETIKDTEQFLDMLVEKYGKTHSPLDDQPRKAGLFDSQNEEQSGGDSIDTDAFLNTLKDRYNDINNQTGMSQDQTGGGQDINLAIDSDRSNFTDTEAFFNKIFKNSKKYQSGGYQYGGGNDFEILDLSGINLNEDFNDIEQSEVFFDQVLGNSIQTGGNHGIKLDVQDLQDFDYEQSDALFNSLFTNTQTGGKRNGRRKLNKNKEGAKKSKSKNYESDMNSESPSYASELGRLIQNQATVIHERVRKRIMDLLKVDKEMAEHYRSALWRMVKEKHPELKSNLDKSVAMANMIDGDDISEKDVIKLLKSIDINKQIKAKKEHLSKQKNKDSKKVTKKPAKKSTNSTEMSATSSAMPSESNFSQTSFTQSLQDSISSSPNYEFSEGSYANSPIFSETSATSFGINNSDSIDIDMEFSEESD